MTDATTGPAVLPYGSWPSPITPETVARGSRPLGPGAPVDGEVWWTEGRPSEAGRTVVCRRTADGEVVDLVPAPWDVRTRVHEYGGAAWTTLPGPDLVFAHFRDQRLYRVPASGGDPVPLTPEPDVRAGLRYAQPQYVAARDEIWCVREIHGADGTLHRDIAAVPADGSGADDPSAIRSVVAGSHFLAHPRLSPDGTRLAWIAWEHPQMPWDGTFLRVGRIGDDGTVASFDTIAGGLEESVLQPEWADDASLYAVSDRSNWWNLYRYPVAGGEATPLHPVPEEFAGPLWMLGSRSYDVLADGRLLVTHNAHGVVRVGILEPGLGQLTPIPLDGLSTVMLGGCADGRAVLLAGGPAEPTAVRVLDLATAALEMIRTSLDEMPDPAYLPVPRAEVFTGGHGREVHANVYPPASPDAVGPEDQQPPYVVFVHGGPTAQSPMRLDLSAAFFTSRGIGVIDVNYGGSTGYGREYRNRLRGQWGVVDVEDTVTAVQELAAAGHADPERLAIRGGSAGGWTTLACLTGTDVFAAGTSYFGVAELLEFARTTHDFESRYLDSLIGSLPEDEQLYIDRAPLSHVDDLSCPVLLIQGLEDPIVPPSQAELFRDALARKGIPHAYVTFEGESHGFRRAESTVRSLEAELSFYGQVLGFATPGVPPLQLTTGPQSPAAG